MHATILIYDDFDELQPCSLKNAYYIFGFRKIDATTIILHIAAILIIKVSNFNLFLSYISSSNLTT